MGPELEFPVIVRSGVTQEGKKLHYLLHYSQEKREISCPFACVRNLLDGKVYEKGSRISLSDWDVKILEEEERHD